MGECTTAWFCARHSCTGDIPYFCRRRFQHLPGGGASHAHGLVELPNAARAVGVLVAVFGIALSLHDLDPAPVGLEFVGEHHGQAGANSGAHLRSMGDDRHIAVLIDAEVDVRRKRLLRRRRGERKRPQSDMKAQHQPGEAGRSLEHDPVC